MEHFYRCHLLFKCDDKFSVTHGEGVSIFSSAYLGQEVCLNADEFNFFSGLSCESSCS